MHYTGQVYRHPMEANTPLLEVTIGCSHNKCTFCTMYRDTKFGVSSIEHIEEDLQELQSCDCNMRRIYLVNADPFVLSTKKLIEIGKLINKYLPKIETITCYTSIKNLKHKSLEELKELRALGYNDLHIGIETAYEPALNMINKGFKVEEAYEQLEKVKEAGMRYDALLMFGIASKGNAEINVRETAKLLNKTKPYMISVLPISVAPGSELEEICNRGEFVESTELEMLEEEKMLINALDIEGCYFFGSHYFNLVPISGNLSNKENIIYYIDEAIENTPKEVLNSVKARGNI